MKLNKTGKKPEDVGRRFFKFRLLKAKPVNQFILDSKCTQIWVSVTQHLIFYKLK